MALASRASFGSFTGCFDTVITDEEERINLAKLDAPQGTSMALLLQLVSTLGDKKYELLFEKEDSNRVKVVPTTSAPTGRFYSDPACTTVVVASAALLSAQAKPYWEAKVQVRQFILAR